MSKQKDTKPTQIKFRKPKSNYFRLPMEWTDLTSEISSIAELKVTEYVIKHTWGYQEYDIPKKITNDEFVSGRKRKDGSRMDKGTGLTKKSVIQGLKLAVQRGTLVEEVDDRDKARVKKSYYLNMASEEEEIDAEKKGNAGVYFLHPEVNTLHPRGEDSTHRSETETLDTTLIDKNKTTSTTKRQTRREQLATKAIEMYQTPETLRDTWSKVLTSLSLQMTQDTFRQHFQDSLLLQIADDTATIAIAKKSSIPWLENRWNDQLKHLLTNSLANGHRAASIRFVALEDISGV